MKKLVTVCLILNFSLLNISVFSQLNSPSNWSQFRGNERNGISEDVGLLDKWPDSGPELIWKKDLGTGFSELIISSDRVFTMFGKTENEQGYEYVAAFDIKTGDEIWRTETDTLYHEIEGWGDGPRSTPAADEKAVYSLSACGKLTALSKADGKILWTVDLVNDLGGTQPRYGYSTSPLLVEDLLIIETGAKDSKTFAAFDKENGKLIWEKGFGRSSYSSPLYAKIDDKTQLIFINDSMLFSYDEKGNENWIYRMPLRGPESMPVFIPPNKIFVSMVSVAGSFIVKIEDNKVADVQENKLIKCLWSTACYKDGYMYSFSNAKLQCNSVETGETMWAMRGFGKGSLILVEDKLLVLSDRGVLKLIEANPEQYNETGSVQALEGKSWTAPSYSDGRVFLRNLTQMACYNLKK